MQLLVHKRNYQWSLKPPKNQQEKVIKQQQQQKNPTKLKFVLGSELRDIGRKAND